LTFNTLFVGLKEQDIIDGNKVKCKAYSKCQNSSDVEEVSIEVYQKLLIHYYSVNLRLLCFYTNKNYRDTGSIKEMMPDKGLESSFFKDSEINKQNISVNRTKVTREKFLHEVSKKENIVVS